MSMKVTHIMFKSAWKNVNEGEIVEVIGVEKRISGNVFILNHKLSRLFNYRIKCDEDFISIVDGVIEISKWEDLDNIGVVYEEDIHCLTHSDDGVDLIVNHEMDNCYSTIDKKLKNDIILNILKVFGFDIEIRLGG